MHVVIRVTFSTLRSCKTVYAVSGETNVIVFWPSVEKCNFKKSKATKKRKRGFVIKTKNEKKNWWQIKDDLKQLEVDLMFGGGLVQRVTFITN